MTIFTVLLTFSFSTDNWVSRYPSLSTKKGTVVKLKGSRNILGIWGTLDIAWLISLLIKPLHLSLLSFSTIGSPIHLAIVMVQSVSAFKCPYWALETPEQDAFHLAPKTGTMGNLEIFNCSYWFLNLITVSFYKRVQHMVYFNIKASVSDTLRVSIDTKSLSHSSLKTTL